MYIVNVYDISTYLFCQDWKIFKEDIACLFAEDEPLSIDVLAGDTVEIECTTLVDKHLQGILLW